MSKHKVSSILDFDIGPHRERGVFFNALVACLSPAEKCDALLADLFQAYPKRAAIVRRILADIQREPLQCHFTLVQVLKARLESLSGRERVTCVMVLLEIVEHLADTDLPGLIDDLVVSPNGNIRKQVYRRIKARPALGLPDSMLSSWRRFGDFEAGRLIIDRASLPVLGEYFPTMERAVAPLGWLLARLYLRFEGSPPATLSRLRDIDPITHAYVLAKLGKRLSGDYLVALYRERMFDERGSLLVWCAGQMGRWSAVTRMQELRDNPPEDVQAAYYASLGIHPNLELLPVPQPPY